MAHNPVNHPARPVFRALGGLIGLYLLAFGILGVIQTSGDKAFAQDDTLVLGQGANLASSVLFIVLGLIIFAVTVIGRNVDVAVYRVLSYGFLALGLAELAVLRTDANYLNFSVVTCIVIMILGLALLLAGMYSKVGSDEDAKAWQDARLVL